MFDGSGRCLEQPNEPADSTFKDKVSLPGYPVQVLAGLVFTYMGPLPAPLITPAKVPVADCSDRVLAPPPALTVMSPAVAVTPPARCSAVSSCAAAVRVPVRRPAAVHQLSPAMRRSVRAAR